MAGAASPAPYALQEPCALGDLGPRGPCFRRSAPGVPGADRYLGDRAAVPCRPVTSLERGPTTRGTAATSHRSREPRVVLSGPPLAGTDTDTNEVAHAAVTRRTGEIRRMRDADAG